MKLVQPCMPWTGERDGKGYGRIERRGVRVAAHRDAFLKAYGFLPPVVRHACDNPPCVEPTHLLPGTQRDNVRDMESRGRAVHPEGEANGRAILTAAQVLEIRASAAAGEPLKALARGYGVSHWCIRSIVARRTWKSVA